MRHNKKNSKLLKGGIVKGKVPLIADGDSLGAIIPLDRLRDLIGNDKVDILINNSKPKPPKGRKISYNCFHYKIKKVL